MGKLRDTEVTAKAAGPRSRALVFSLCPCRRLTPRGRGRWAWLALGTRVAGSTHLGEGTLLPMGLQGGTAAQQGESQPGLGASGGDTTVLAEEQVRILIFWKLTLWEMRDGTESPSCRLKWVIGRHEVPRLGVWSPPRGHVSTLLRLGYRGSPTHTASVSKLPLHEASCSNPSTALGIG